MTESQKNAADLHQNVPSDWYAKVIKTSPIHRFWHNRRFEEVEKYLEEADTVLDIGCNDGTFTKVVFDKTKPKSLIGIDVLPKSISYAKRRFARSKRMRFLVADAHSIPYKNENFNAVVCLEALEHMENPVKVLSEMHRVLKKNGYALILVPSENFLFCFGWFFWELGPGRIWRGTHTHTIDPGNISAALEKLGFEISENRTFLAGMLRLVKARKK